MENKTESSEMRESIFRTVRPVTNDDEEETREEIPRTIIKTPVRRLPYRTLSQEASLFNNTIETRDHTENIYQSCCGGTSDKRLIILGAQIGISATVILFSCSMLALLYNTSSCDSGLYIGLLTTTMAFWFGKSNEDRK